MRTNVLGKSKPAGKMGRPREFDVEVAVEAGMRVFWEKGYDGATLSDPTSAMRINRSSMYTIFGDKEALFRMAIDRYADGPAVYVRKSVEESTARDVIESLLHGALELLSNPRNPRGCLSVQGALANGTGGETVKQVLIDWRKCGEALLEKRFRRAQKEGDLKRSLDPGDLARYVSALLTGLGVQAANGASRKQMSYIVDLAVSSLPI